MEQAQRSRFRSLERLMKGVANHRRIEILELLHKNPDLSLIEVARTLRINFKTGSEHIRRLAWAGLVEKRNLGASVLHKLSERGILILKFLSRFNLDN